MSRRTRNSESSDFSHNTKKNSTPKGKRVLNPFDGKLSDSPVSGLSNTELLEKQPDYNLAPAEKEIRGDNNTRIVLGRDRNVGLVSGYGGKGHTRSGAIDIVVGMQGWDPATGGKTKSGVWINGVADRNFGSMNNDRPGDAARIYVSQRANIDEYFDICDGNVGTSVACSAIGIKADSVRIMSRKGIKLVTSKAPPGRNSIDGKLKVTYGIDLIAGNRDVKTGLEGLHKFNPARDTDEIIEYLQPIPKGLNLVSYLDKLHENVQLNNSILAGLLTIMPSLCNAVLSPKQVVGAIIPAASALPLGPGFNPAPVYNVLNYLILTQKQNVKLHTSRLQMGAYKIDYLDVAGALHINSRHNRTN
jgi:hypothetical protein